MMGRQMLHFKRLDEELEKKNLRQGRAPFLVPEPIFTSSTVGYQGLRLGGEVAVHLVAKIEFEDVIRETRSALQYGLEIVAPT